MISKPESKESSAYDKKLATIAIRKSDILNQRAVTWMTHKDYPSDDDTKAMLVSIIKLFDAKADYRKVRALNIDGLKSSQDIGHFKRKFREFEATQPKIKKPPKLYY